jgi:TP901 family phage tail tape measure protein
VVLNESNRLAIAGVADIDQATEALSKTMNAFGLTESEVADISDSLFAAVKGGITTIPQLSANIGKIAPIAAKAGVRLEEMNAGLATITKTGLSTDEAATALRATITAILKPTGDVRRAAEDLGVDFSTAALQTKGFAGFLDDIQKKSGPTAKQMAELEKRSAATGDSMEDLIKAQTITNITRLFPNVRALNGVLALTSAEGKNFADNMDLQAQRAGNTGEAFETMSKTQAFAFDQTRAQLDKTIRALGEGFSPAVTDALKDVTALATVIKEFADEHPDAVREVGSLLIKLVAFGAVLRTTLLLVSTVSSVKGLGGMVGPLARVATGAGKGATTMKALSGGIKLTAGGLAGAAGLILLAGAAGVALGTMLDKALGLSDALAGVNQEIDQFKGGAPAFRGTLTTEERGRLTKAQQELSAAQQEREELKGGAAGIVLSEQGLNFFSDTDERIEAAKKTIDEINAAGRGRQAKFGATAFEIGEVERERGVTREEQAAVAAQERAADAAAGRARVDIKVTDERVTTRVAESTGLETSVDGGIREIGA